MDHVLYKTGDKDAPNSILDNNGEVVLSMCRNCRRGESELRDPKCPAEVVQMDTLEAYAKANFADLSGYHMDVRLSELEMIAIVAVVHTPESMRIMATHPILDKALDGLMLRLATLAEAKYA